MKDNHNTFVYLCLFLLILCISSQANEIKKLKAKRPATIYYVDNMAGIVTGKEFDGNR